MTVVWIVLGLILILVGILGSVLPVLPGPLLSYGALLLLQFTGGYPFSTEFLIVRALIIIAITILDYVRPIIGTKKFGGTKYGNRGSTIGLVVSVIILPILGITIGPFGLIGLIAGPFIGAYIGEKWGGKAHHHALRSAVGSFIGFLVGMLAKLVISVVMGVYFVIEAVKILFN